MSFVDVVLSFFLSDNSFQRKVKFLSCWLVPYSKKHKCYPGNNFADY